MDGLFLVRASYCRMAMDETGILHHLQINLDSAKHISLVCLPVLGENGLPNTGLSLVCYCMLAQTDSTKGLERILLTDS